MVSTLVGAIVGFFGMAIGILTAGLRLTDEAAFQRLRRASNQQRNVELRMVAEEVVHEGALD